MKTTRKTFGALAIAMLLIGGLIAPAAAGTTGDQPGPCQSGEYEYGRTVTTEGDREYFKAGDEPAGWEPTGESKKVVTQEYVPGQTEVVTDWFQNDPGTPWTATGESRVDQDATFVTEFEWVNPGGQKKWSTSLAGNWTKTGNERSTETQPKIELFKYTKTEVIREEVPEESHTEFEYVEIIETTEKEFFVSDPSGDWEATGETRIVDIPDCDLFELSPSNPAAGQCDAGEGAIKLDTGDRFSDTVNVNGTNVTVTVEGKTVTFSSAVMFCVKAANGSSGLQTGTSYTVDFKNRGGNFPDISNVVIYVGTPGDSAPVIGITGDCEDVTVTSDQDITSYTIGEATTSVAAATKTVKIDRDDIGSATSIKVTSGTTTDKALDVPTRSADCDKDGTDAVIGISGQCDDVTITSDQNITSYTVGSTTTTPATATKTVKIDRDDLDGVATVTVTSGSTKDKALNVPARSASCDNGGGPTPNPVSSLTLDAAEECIDLTEVITFKAEGTNVAGAATLTVTNAIGRQVGTYAITIGESGQIPWAVANNGLAYEKLTLKVTAGSLSASDDVDLTTIAEACTDVEEEVIEKPVDETPEGKTPEDETPEGKTPEGKTPEGKTPEDETDVLDDDEEKVTPIVKPIVKTEVLGKVIEAKEMPRTGVPALALILMGLTSLGLGSSLVRRKRS